MSAASVDTGRRREPHPRTMVFAAAGRREAQSVLSLWGVLQRKQPAVCSARLSVRGARTHW